MTPIRFEDYLAQRTPGIPREGDRCTACLKGKPISVDGYCRECLRYHHGWDEAEEKVVDALIGGAITAALELGTSSELITLAVHRAIQRHHERVEDEIVAGITAVHERRLREAS